MRLWPRHRAPVLALLAGSAACSLRSLDYLDRGEASAGAAAAAAAGFTQSGGSSGTSNAGAGGSGMAGKSGAGGSEGGSGNTSSGGTGTAGAGGGASGANGAGASGGTSDPAGGTGGSGGTSGAGGSDMGGAGGEDGSAGSGEGGVPSCMPGEPGCPPAAVEEIPYVLRPGHAPEKCVDMNNFDVDEGAMAIQYTCYHQINQVFWVEEHADGYVAVRNALSGKCLEVAGASLVEDAPIEQWSCDGKASQLFLPVAAGDGLFKLVLQHSELLLDVTGSASTDNVLPLVQNADDGQLDKTWQLERSDVGAFVTLAAEDDRDLRLRHDGDEILMEASAEGSAEWKVVPGLANRDCVSFGSRDDSNRYLRQQSFELFREANDGSDAFALDATFCFRAPLAGNGASLHALESEAYPGYYLVRNDGRVYLQQSEDTVEFRTAASWRLGQLRP